MLIRYLLITALLSWQALATAGSTTAFDHSEWDRLLQAHVVPLNNGVATAVDYQGMAAQRAWLNEYLAALAAVDQEQFDRWPTSEQLAFLINAYNAWTVELILTAWPDLESIKDLGSLFRSPWRQAFVTLLGEQRSLDDIEHQLIRGSGRYNEPRIHFAVNCASIGCPALRVEAYTGSKLDRQLDEQTKRFLKDRSRNRITADTLQISSIFKWYREDFEKGWQGFHHLTGFLAAYADALGLSATQVKQLQAGNMAIEYLDYDWRLNQQR